MTGSISVGGAASVATAHLDELRYRLARASAECSEIVVRLQPLRTHDSAAREADLDDSDRAIRGARDRFDELAGALGAAVELYSATERAAATAAEALVAQVAASVGFIASRLGIVVAPALVNAAVVTAAVWGLLPSAVRDDVTAAGRGALDSLEPALSDPRVVALLRAALSLIDDAALGAIGVPPNLVAALGETGLGVSSIDSAALAVLGLAALAGARGTAPVYIDRVESDYRRGGMAPASIPPTTLADRVDRVPDPATPIVIERYQLPDGTWHFEVYIAGTDSKAELGGDRPWDMSSNIALVAEQDASSLQAVRAAMIAIGVTADASVTFTGYSQGGAIATALAESGQWNTTGLVTVGAPTGGMPVQGAYPAIVIEHREDLVPVLSGIRRETTAVIVRADALSVDAPGDGALPAHDRDRYLATAAAVDAHDHRLLQETIAALPTGASAGERFVFTATRIRENAD